MSEVKKTNGVLPQLICKLSVSYRYTKRENLAILLLPQWVLGANQVFLGERTGRGKEDDSTITKPEKKTTDRNFSVVSENVLQIRIVLENGLWPSQPLLQSRGYT